MIPKLQHSDFTPQLIKDPLDQTFTLKNAFPKPRLEIKYKTFITREILCPVNFKEYIYIYSCIEYSSII